MSEHDSSLSNPFPDDPHAQPAEASAADVLDVAAVAKQRDEYYDALLRKGAEFDNYRKRVERERREQAELAGADLIKELLPLVDDLERALAADAADAGPYRQGVELIHRRLLDMLAKRGVQVLNPLGEDFDPRWHEAVAREQAAGHRDGEVIDVFTRGYRLGERLLRPAMVKVATA